MTALDVSSVRAIMDKDFFSCLLAALSVLINFLLLSKRVSKYDTSAGKERDCMEHGKGGKGVLSPFLDFGVAQARGFLRC